MSDLPIIRDAEEQRGLGLLLVKGVHSINEDTSRDLEIDISLSKVDLRSKAFGETRDFASRSLALCSSGRSRQLCSNSCNVSLESPPVSGSEALALSARRFLPDDI
jgi:hypothetical protein